MNHEALTDQTSCTPRGSTARPAPGGRRRTRRSPAHGVSVVEVQKTNGAFAYVKDSAFNRRVTPLTPMQLSGPARGNALMKTQYSPDGTDARGTINNCGTGYTPWGTFLTGEENWAGYFTRGAADDAARGNDKSVTSLNRYGRAQGAASRHGWETAGADDKYARWDISKAGASADGTDDYRNELNTFGYVVEIDPYDKAAAVKKRTALGRFAHESAACGRKVRRQAAGACTWATTRAASTSTSSSPPRPGAPPTRTPANRIATGDKYLDSGKLYVAKFNADGSGAWIELNIANAGDRRLRDVRFRRPGRRAGQCAPRRRRGRRDEDGPPRMVRGASRSPARSTTR